MRTRTSMRLAAAVAVGGLALAACGGPVKMGAAATTGQQRISTATLTNEVANLNAAYQANTKKGVKPQRPVGQVPQQVLTWLITFSIYNELARLHGISVTPTAVQNQLTQLSTQAKQQSLTVKTYVSAAGAVPPDLLPQLGRYFAILTAFEARLDGGTQPTGQAAQQALQTRIAHAQCLAAKNLDVKVNPQYGQFDYATYSVVPAASKLAAASSPSPKPSAKPRLTPPC
ncbi:MAG TPA: SurA N-terminal domain-containing protein [Streptosporangiaceae bacterium]|nr:SurA N-terminal domain-containing protein [Streptosporangiaceae bacterium]